MFNALFSFLIFLPLDSVPYYSPGLLPGMVIASIDPDYDSGVTNLDMIERIEYEDGRKVFISQYRDFMPNGFCFFQCKNYLWTDSFEDKFLIDFCGKQVNPPIPIRDIMKRGIWIQNGNVLCCDPILNGDFLEDEDSE